MGAMPRPDMDLDQVLSAPQATLMTTIAQGIFSSELAWEYIYIGMGLGLVLILIDQLLKKTTQGCALPPWAVGMGIYLPPSVQVPLVVGAVMGYFVNKSVRKAKGEEGEAEGLRRGTLFASGMIVGESIIGVILAGIIVVSISSGGSDSPLAIAGFEAFEDILGFIVFMVVMTIFVKVIKGNPNN